MKASRVIGVSLAGLVAALALALIALVALPYGEAKAFPLEG